MIGEILEEERIRLRLQGRTKKEILKELVDLISSSDEEREKLLRVILDREERMSTGVGKGVAMPRGRIDFLSQLRGAFGMKPEGVDFEALDGAPVNTFFLLVAPKGEDSSYVKAISLLARILNQDSFRESLLKAKSETEVLVLFKEEEQSR